MRVLIKLIQILFCKKTKSSSLQLLKVVENMDGKENVTTKILWKHNTSSEIQQCETQGKKTLQTKRSALGDLSNNLLHPGPCCVGTKQTNLPVIDENSKKATSFKTCEKIVPVSPRQSTSFRIYTDGDEQQKNVPWPSLDLAVYSTEIPSSDNGLTPLLIDSPLVSFAKDIICSPETVTEDNQHEYQMEIHNYLKEAEKRHQPKPDFMNGQPMINKSMRAILVDWLVEVAEEYHLVPETLYLTINFVDRFLSCDILIEPSRLQLLGVACMLIASKIEEIYPPEISEFVYITNSSYTEEELRQMETLVLKELSFDMAAPTVMSFLDRYERVVKLPDQDTKQCSFLTKYYCELSLQASEIQWKYFPSVVAASSVILAISTLGYGTLIGRLEEHTEFELAELYECISDIYRIVSRAGDSKLQAIKDKYSESRFGCVATLALCEPIFIN